MASVNDVALGAWLRAVRQTRGLRQWEVARAMGWDRPTVSAVEAGRRSLKVVELPQYLVALRSSAAEFHSVLVNSVMAVLRLMDA